MQTVQQPGYCSQFFAWALKADRPHVHFEYAQPIQPQSRIRKICNTVVSFVKFIFMSIFNFIVPPCLRPHARCEYVQIAPLNTFVNLKRAQGSVTTALRTTCARVHRRNLSDDEKLSLHIAAGGMLANKETLVFPLTYRLERYS